MGGVVQIKHPFAVDIPEFCASKLLFHRSLTEFHNSDTAVHIMSKHTLILNPFGPEIFSHSEKLVNLFAGCFQVVEQVVASWIAVYVRVIRWIHVVHEPCMQQSDKLHV